MRGELGAVRQAGNSFVRDNRRLRVGGDRPFGRCEQNQGNLSARTLFGKSRQGKSRLDWR